MTKLGKLWTGAVAYVSLLVAAGVSMAGNLADTYRTRAGQVDSLDKVLAVIWPLFVILAIEMFVNPRWKRTPMFQAWRWLGCLAIGGMAMVASWTHLHDLMASRGQLPVVAILGPLAIDGMAIMATGLILSTRVRGHVVTDTMAADTMGDRLSSFRTAMTDAAAADVYAVDTVTDDELSGYRRWADLMDTDKPSADLMEWVSGQERARADIADSLATEMSAYLATVTDAAPLPKRTRAAGASYPADMAEYVQAWDPAALKRADMVALLAGHYGVSGRTVRRWLAAYTGQPVSGPPEKS